MLASDSGLLARIKNKLATNRITSPLFDAQRFTKNLESAFEAVVAQYLDCGSPVNIHVRGVSDRNHIDTKDLSRFGVTQSLGDGFPSINRIDRFAKFDSVSSPGLRASAKPDKNDIKFCYLFFGSDSLRLLELSIASLKRICVCAAVEVYCLGDGGGVLELAERLHFRVFFIEDWLMAGHRDFLSVGGYKDFGTAGFNIITSYKWSAIQASLRDAEEFVVYTDFDVYFIRDPLPYLRCVMRDHAVAVQSESLPVYPPTLCTGFMVFKKGVEDRLSAFAELNRSFVPDRNDQDFFNSFFRADLEFRRSVCVLPESLFPNGLHWRSFLQIPARSHVGALQPFLFHANWVKGAKGKIELLKHCGFFGDADVSEEI